MKMLWYRRVLFGLAITICFGGGFCQYSSNIFFNGEYQNGIKANPSKLHSVSPASNIFLEHAILSRQASPFQGPTYLPPEENLKCSVGKQCVLKGQCQNEYFTIPSQKAQNCKASTHICCIYRPPLSPTTTQRPFDICLKDFECVSSRFCSNGEIEPMKYTQKSENDRCYSPDICCRMPSTLLTDDGYILRTPDIKFTIPTTARTEQSLSTPKQLTSLPQSLIISPQKEYLPLSAYSTTFKLPAPQKEYIPPPVTTPYRQDSRSTARSAVPTQPEPRPKPQNGYLPPSQTIHPFDYHITPTATPSRQVFIQTPYKPPVTDIRSTPPSVLPTQPEPRPTPQNAYLPPSQTNQPTDYHVTQPSNTVIRTVTTAPPRLSKPMTPLRGEDILSLPLDKRLHLVKCASALECTPENKCNSIGVITDKAMELTPAEAAFRVPLTDCLLNNGSPGKCCRDANYVDPWPINLAGVCATRNLNTKPQGIQDFDANFGEIPWQAMILKESSKTILGGGAIIGDQIVVTAASVVKGVSHNDLKVKGGEWELGRDSEPLPFQIVGVKSIDIHPEYNPATGSNDMALLRLDKRVEFAQHIKPICVSNEDPKPGEKCITTGWGKQAIQIHEEGAIMHVANTILEARTDCSADNTSVCSSIVHDACQFDVGSALACGTGSHVMLKGVYAAENACGEGQTVRFSKPDLKWINGFFTLHNKGKLLKKRWV